MAAAVKVDKDAGGADTAARGKVVPLGRERGRAPSGQLVTVAVRRAQAGDRGALAFLYARFADDVYCYVRSLLRDRREAEEVTRQVFAKLALAIGEYEEHDVPFLAWVFRVARNLAVDHLRLQGLTQRPNGQQKAAHDRSPSPRSVPLGGGTPGVAHDAIAVDAAR